MADAKNIVIVAGEPSGDLQASLLVDSFRGIYPEAKFWGFGGEKMRSAGVETIIDIGELAVMGFVDVIKDIPRLKKLMRMLLHEVERRKPSGAILVDYPGFNLSLAKKIKKMNLPLAYYISPQLWAWAEGRVKKIRKYVDKMVCILPFEKEFYIRHGISVDYVGHPFIDIVTPEISAEEFRRSTGIEGDFIVLLPGSRTKEIYRLLPSMLETYKTLTAEGVEISAIIASAQGTKDTILELISGKEIPIIEGATYSAMSYAKAGLVSSGSATLECLISGLPAVVVYRVDRLSWMIGKRMIKVQSIALANLIAGEAVYPEFVQYFTPDILADAIKPLILDEPLRQVMKQKLEGACGKLGAGGASDNAAKILAQFFFGIFEKAGKP